MTLNFSEITNSIEFKQFLRYGENPHQEAAWFTFPKQGLTDAQQLQGKELSYKVRQSNEAFYTQYLNDSSVYTINTHFKRDCEKFGYTF